MNFVLPLLLIALSPIKFSTPRYRDIPTNDKPAINQDAAITRFNAEFVRANAETDSCHNGQLDLIEAIRSSSISCGSISLDKRKNSLRRTCNHSYARVQRVGRLFKIDYQWMTAKEIAGMNDLGAKENEILSSIFRIGQLIHQATH
jgi:hypothetical protein